MKNKKRNSDWIVLPDASDVAAESLKLINKSANDAIQSNGVFRLVLAGGTTPERIYEMLAKEKHDWSKWEFFLGDDRCLETSSNERNSQMAKRTLLDKIKVPEKNLYFIPSELGAEISAKIYADTIKKKMPFDLVLLGMGEDGHTASLFPGHKHNNDEIVHSVYNSPKPPSDRVSLSASSLSNAHQVLIIVTGAGKRDSVEAWVNGELLPISKISALEKLTVLLDEAAYPKSI